MNSYDSGLIMLHGTVVPNGIETARGLLMVSSIKQIEICDILRSSKDYNLKFCRPI